MNIINSIQTARERGASDNEIFQQIANQNPQKSAQFSKAIERGATPTIILDEILKQNNSVPETETEKLGFAQRFGADLEKRKRMAENIADAVSAGEQSYAEGVLQIAGKVGVGGTFDLMSETLISGARGLSAITPDIIENPIKDLTTSAFHKFLNTSIGQQGLKALKTGMSAYDDFKEKNPRAARNIEAVVNVSLMFAPLKKKVPTKPTKLAPVAKAIEEKAISQRFATKSQFIDDLIRPEQAKAVKIAQVGRTKEIGISVFKRKEITPSLTEQAMTKEVLKIPGVSSKNTLQGNYTIIAKENVKVAKTLENNLLKNDIVFPRNEYFAALNKAKITLAENPLIVGDAVKTSEKIMNKMIQIFSQEKSSASGLLKARKSLDKWISQQKGKKIFDPTQENALSIALREIRQTTNAFIDSKAVNVQVKQSLQTQSKLFSALDNIAPKAAHEAENAILRAWQNVTRILPLRGEFNQTMALLFGIGGLGASAMFAPIFTKLVLGGLITYQAGKMILSANAKIGVSKLLKTIDIVIRKTTDANLIKELRIDKVLLLELLKKTQTKTQETDREENE